MFYFFRLNRESISGAMVQRILDVLDRRLTSTNKEVVKIGVKFLVGHLHADKRRYKDKGMSSEIKRSNSIKSLGYKNFILPRPRSARKTAPVAAIKRLEIPKFSKCGTRDKNIKKIPSFSARLL